MFILVTVLLPAVQTHINLTTDIFTIDFGGVNVSFTPVTNNIKTKPAPKFSGFETDQLPKSIFRVHLQEYQGNPLGISSFCANNWVIHRLSSNFVIEFGTKDMPKSKYAYTVKFNPDVSGGEIYLNQRAINKDHSPIDLPPSMLDEVMAAQLLAYHHGLIFHACGIQVNPDTGYAFAGTSGAGKTTSARLWGEHTSTRLLSDERLVIRKQSKRFFIHSTPWHSPEFLTCRLQVPLSKLFILQHSEINRIRRLDVTEAVSLLLQRAYLPSWDFEGMEKTLEFLEQLCTTIPCYEFGFTPNQSAIQFIQCLRD